ncbi:MAG: PAS domain S-box protein [Candidatus Hydrogenedentes bacterium]|nr:PAS domain S-box protein [Candidatus Hydrogenedentota bacterium]
MGISLSGITHAGQNLRKPVLLTLLGVCIEIEVVIASFILSEVWREWGRGLFGSTKIYHQWHQGNSLLGLFGSLILVLGVTSFSRKLRISRAALNWVYVAGGFLIILKSFDVVNTVFVDYMDRLFESYPDMDSFINNLLILCGCLTVLVGLMWAMYDISRLNITLSEQNAQLDREMQERSDTESRLSVQEKRLSSILQALPSPVFLLNIDGFILAHNKFFALLWGRGEENLVGLHLRQVLPEALFERGKSFSMRVFERNAPENYVVNISNRTYEINTYPTMDEEGNVPSITVLALDITDKLRGEEERRLLQEAVNSAAESIIIVDETGLIEYVNPAFEEQSGYSRKEVQGQLYNLMHSEALDEALIQEIKDTLEQGKSWRGRLISQKKDGALMYETATISPITNQDGVIKHYVSVKRNITRELQLEQQLQQAQKLEALGTMAGGITHNLNNVLAIILGRSELGAQMLEAENPARENFEIIMRTAARSSDMIKRLLTFSRKQAGGMKPVEVAPLIREQLSLMRNYLPSNITILEAILLDKEIIIADAVELQQAFVNLINNANYAMQPEGGELEIGLDKVCIDNELLATTGMLSPGDYVRLRVRDTGCGMDSDTQMRMFDPFFTTKAADEGTGLGLPMVHGSVLRAGGQIQVESAPGKGTEISLYLPAAEETARGIEEASLEMPVSGRGITVMVVDDMADFSDLLTMNLEYFGFEVCSFSDPEEAMAFFSDNPDMVKVAVLDYMMPGMNGKDLGAALKNIRPGLPLVLLSGYACGITNENARDFGFSAMFDKPVEISTLARMLASLVSQS